MPRALSSAVGALLAPAAILLACRALAQAPVLETRSQPIPAPQVSPEDRALSEAHLRLEEMKVNLALLADTATFPYYIGACGDGGELELRGLVPNATIKQRALDLAGRCTYLKVRDGLKISDSLSPPSVVRAPQVLQQEAAELLVKHFGEARRKIGLQARPNGQLIITGPIDSMETKLAVSRQFRQLPGCYGVLNELIVEETLREGKRVVPVTNGSLMVPVAALETKSSTLSSTTPDPRIEAAKPIPTPTMPPAKTESVAISQAEQVRRPILPAPPSIGKTIPEGAWEAQHTLSPTPVVAERVAPSPPAAKTEHTADALTTPPLPKSWQRSAMTWESALPSNTKTPAITPDPHRTDSLAQPVHIAQSVTPVIPASQPQTKPIENTSGPISSFSAVDSSTHFQSSSPSMTWKRPSSSEESETKSNSTTASNPSPNAVRPSVAQPIQSTRRWPPAYESAPAATPNNDRANVVVATPSTLSKAVPTPSNDRSTVVTSKLPTPSNDRTSVIVSTPPSSSSKEQPSAKVTPTPAASKPQPSVNVATPPAPNQGKSGVIVFDEKKPAAPAGQPGMISFEEDKPKPAASGKAQQGTIIFEDDKTTSAAPAGKGQPGMIVFDDEKAPGRTVAPSSREMPLPISVPDLQRLIRAVGGQQVKDVVVENLRDGGVNVRVKVPNNTVQDQLSGKILAIPGMISPRIHLIMDVVAP